MRRDAGFTIIEMLVVIGLLGVLMALGVGGYLALNRGYDLQAIEGNLEAVVRHARNSTLYESAPAGAFLIETFRLELRDPTEFVEGELLAEGEGKLSFAPEGRLKPLIIPKSRVVRRESVRALRAIGFKTVAMWHLEMSDNSVGYLGRGCRPENCEEALGKIGGAVYLNANKRSRSRIVALPAPDDGVDPFRLHSGGRIVMWVYAARASAGYLVRREKSYELKVNQDGVLEGGPAGSTVSTDGYALPLGRWVHVVMTFAPTYVEISADGVTRGVEECSGFEMPYEGELAFGQHFVGLLDEIRIQRRVSGEAVEIPSDFEYAGPEAIVFDHRGRLDAKHHAGPVVVRVTRDTRFEEVTISRSGLIE